MALNPQALTEPELLQLMDKNGIGTDATMAQHIEKQLDRGYGGLGGLKADLVRATLANQICACDTYRG
jgi:DNA topoisomerase IA